MEKRELTEKQKIYLRQVKNSLTQLQLAFEGLNDVWNRQMIYEFDLNDALYTMYPFDKSFDELQKDVDLWINDGKEKLKTIEPY